MTLVRVTDINSAFPDLRWPFSPHSTWRLIRVGKLGAVKVGRHRYITRELLEAFVRAHVVAASSAA